MTRRYRFVVYQDRKKEWRWRLVASNGKIVADSAEGYKKKAHAVKMINRIRLALDYSPVIQEEEK